jgi:hypothetical protein
VAQLDNVEPALPRLVLADKRLGYIEPNGDIDLGESSFLAEQYPDALGAIANALDAAARTAAASLRPQSESNGSLALRIAR